MRSKLLLLAIVVCSFLYALMYIHMTVDDTFTFLRFARNMLDGKGISFNPGEPTYGFTSVTWLVLLYLAGLVSTNLLINAKVMSALFAVGSIFQFYNLLNRLIADKKYVLTGTLIWASNPVLLTAYFSGMETALGVFLLLSALLLQIKERSRTEAIGWSPILYALCYLTRPEMLMLAVLGFVDFALFSPREHKIKRLLWFLFSFALIVGAWLSVAAVSFGTITPNPVLIKAGQSTKIYALRDVFTRTALMLLSINATDVLLLVGAVSLVLFFGRWRHFRLALHDLNTVYLMLVGWILAVLGGYLLQRVEVSPRNLLIVSPLLTAFAVLLLSYWLKARSGLRPFENNVMILVAFVYLIQSFAATAMIYRPHTESYNGKDVVLTKVAQWMRNHTAKNTSVATVDIGILGYFSERRVVDVTGLINTDIIHAGSTINYLRAKNIDFYLDRNPIPGYLGNHNPHALMVAYEPVLFLSTPSTGLKYGYVEEREIGFTLYRVHWK